jgi:hypothetical protein
MTIVVAMKENDNSILLSSDSGAFDASTNLRFNNCRKLSFHPKALLAWGYSGNPSIGWEDFTPWLKSYNWPPIDWRTFRNQAIDKLAELTGEQRKLAIKAGAKSDEGNLADCLIVGYLDRPEIYYLGVDGNAQSYWDMGFNAIGNGANNAWVSYTALEYLRPKIPKLIELMIVMQNTTQTAIGCEIPCYIWRITEEGIWEGLEKGENAKKLIHGKDIGDVHNAQESNVQQPSTH